MPIESPSYHLYVWLTSNPLEVPLTSFLSSINLWEPLTELRETFYLLDYWFIIKEPNSGIARWKRCRGLIMGKGVEFPCSLQAHCPTWSHVDLPGSSMNPSPLGDFMDISSCRHDWSLSLFSAILPSQESGDWGWKFQTSGWDQLGE